jgi:hypothetical protein
MSPAVFGDPAFEWGAEEFCSQMLRKEGPVPAAKRCISSVLNRRLPNISYDMFLLEAGKF